MPCPNVLAVPQPAVEMFRPFRPPPLPYYYKVRTGILSRGGGLYHGDVDIVGVENNKLVGGGLESNSTEEDHLAVERERWLNI